jgi:energy-coupling factor transporter ATP-binding protein EcfA2
MPWKTIILLVVAFAPPAGFGALQWEEVRSNPVVSAVFAAVSVLWVALVGFVGKVWKELEPRWSKAGAEWVDAQTQRMLSGFGLRRRYYRQLRYRHRVFNVRGLQTQGTFTLELDKVFVGLRIAPQNPQEASTDPLRVGVLAGNRGIWDFLVSKHEAYRCLALVGAPGSGKTTLLQHLALTFAQNRQRRYDRRCRAFVPVFLFLRDHVKAITADVAPTLARLVTDQEKAEGLTPPPDWFERKLLANRCLVLLDGLDEVADADQRKKVSAWVDKQMELYGGNRFVVTSRIHGYRANPLRQATVLEVQPFTTEQVEQFVNSWYLANEILSFGKDDEGVRSAAAKKASDLLRRLRNTPSLAAMALNPLLLTMIATVHRYRAALPGRRVELYSEICDVFLGHWRQAKGLTSNLTPAQKRAVLMPVAFHMMEQKTREITESEAGQIGHNPLRRVGVTTQEARAAFFKDIEDDSGLLIQRRPGLYSFTHQTFQEYLAATHLLSHRDSSEDILARRIEDAWWHETIRLCAAQGDATNIIRACLAAAGRNVAALVLAYECSNEARDVEPEIREQLERGIWRIGLRR